MAIIQTVIQGGGTTPTGTKPITANGVYDVTDYANADVQVPTTAPACYRALEKNSGGKLVNSTSNPWVPLPAGTIDLDQYIFYYAYYNTPSTILSGEIDLSSLQKLSGAHSCESMFKLCTGLTSVNLSNLTTISGDDTCVRMFDSCSGLTSVNLSNLTTIANRSCSLMFTKCTSLTSVDLRSLLFTRSNSSCESMFSECTNLTSVDLSSLCVLSSYACRTMFTKCTSLTSVDLSSLVSASNSYSCESMFSECTNLTSVDLSHLCKLGTSNNISKMFYKTSLSSLSFPNLAYTTTDINSSFQNTLQQVTGCTVHFPSDWETAMSSWSNITNGLGGTNTTVLFDLPAVNTLDLSNITVIDGYHIFYQFAQNNYFPNITSVDMSGLTLIKGDNSCDSMFKNCTSLTSIDLSSLTMIRDSGSCSYIFSGCTNLTSVDLSSLTTINTESDRYITSTTSFMFQKCTSLTSIDLSSLTSIYGDSDLCQAMFDACSGLTSVDLSGLTTVLGSNCIFQWMFSGCTNLTSVDLSGLTIIGRGNDICNQMFKNCTSLSSVVFSSLSKDEGSARTFKEMFMGCTNLSYISFPSLVKVTAYNSFYNMLSGVTGCTIHFPSNMQSRISSLSGYPNFGGTNTTVLFDLPATNTLTGADTITYTRNPKYDTATALAWKVGDYGTTNFTPAYYTSGTTDPVVGDTIYSDSACTTSVTTISTIA